MCMRKSDTAVLNAHAATGGARTLPECSMPAGAELRPVCSLPRVTWNDSARDGRLPLDLPTMGWSPCSVTTGDDPQTHPGEA
jgi:hypothetical protein